MDDAKSSPTTDDEKERVLAVYARYEADPYTHAKWDPRNPGNALILEEFTTALLALLKREGVQLGDATILDVGCGSGVILSWLAQCGASKDRLYGVDLREDQIEVARTNSPAINFFCADARQLAFPDRSFDVVICHNLFGSILDQSVADAVATEIRRVVRPAGSIVWCDSRYPNPWNPNVRGYTFQQIRRLFPACRITLRSITVLPPLARRLGRLTLVLYPLLARVPFLRVRYLGIVHPETGRLTTDLRL